MKTIKILYLICIILITAHQAFSQQIQLNLDWAVFQYDQEHLSLEIYYSLLQSQINYAVQNDKLIGITLSRFQAFKNDALIIDHAWKNQNVLTDSNSADEPKEIIDQARFQMKPGNYQCKFTLQDLQKSSNRDSISWSLELAQPEKSKPYFSQIQFASSIKQDPAAKDSPFYKNTLVIYPNPSLIYDRANPVLFFYAEAYNLSHTELPADYCLSYYVTDANEKMIYSIKPRKVKKAQAVHPSVEFGLLNVGELPSGAYALHVAILDQQEQIVISQQKKFFIYQMDETNRPVNEAKPMPPNIFLSLDSAQVETEFLLVSYLMNQPTKNIWLQIKNLEGKRNFLYQFWSAHDPDPMTPENEFRNDILIRLTYANKAFRSFRTEGWRTDRGRVYLVYGAPSDVERFPNEPNCHPYEIWSYNDLQGGVIFVFADLDGYENYRLLHSTLIGEIKDYDYMSVIRKGD